jgi:hypothetical protein
MTEPPNPESPRCPVVSDWSLVLVIWDFGATTRCADVAGAGTGAETQSLNDSMVQRLNGSMIQ